ncbi:36533_t:CDS:2 [Gigaspora margarita]|uniref:36533_t:CDS:1 n=1 Tax=Gigaspora margarita TaxID=4874 RepID=A0ABN7W9V3_GIGMA|nr:36533_t:CDS:2 [Gigaspora margarita]
MIITLPPLPRVITTSLRPIMTPQHRPIQGLTKGHLIPIVNSIIEETDVVNYDPEEDENFLESNPFYYVSREYAQYCLNNDDFSRLSIKDAQNIVDQS